MQNKYLRLKLAVRKAQKAKKEKEEKMIKKAWQIKLKMIYLSQDKERNE